MLGLLFYCFGELANFCAYCLFLVSCMIYMLFGSLGQMDRVLSAISLKCEIWSSYRRQSSCGGIWADGLWVTWLLVPKYDVLPAAFWILITAPMALQLPNAPPTNSDSNSPTLCLSHTLVAHGTSAAHWETLKWIAAKGIGVFKEVMVKQKYIQVLKTIFI